jgi:SAM-dependent methyltransferase
MNTPIFDAFIARIGAKSPLQRKAIGAFLAAQGPCFRGRAERFAEKFVRVLDADGFDIDYVVDAYLKMCNDMLREQIKFKRTGRYSCGTAAEAYAAVYSSARDMASYMYALALSIFLWPNHYGLFDFFLRETGRLTNVSACLEIGPGHGVFLAESMRRFPEAKFVAVDISPISIRIAEEVVAQFTGRTDCRFELQDIMEGALPGCFDYVVACEVLEHVDAPGALMRRLRDGVSEGGRLFITTCANAPAIDHVYLFESVAHIRREIRASGWAIESDIALPVGEFPEELWVKERVEINYAAMLLRADT